MDGFSAEQLSTHTVRLFPSAHIQSEREAEQRATASLLAMIRAVSEFGRSLVKKAGGPAGKIECYTELPFAQGNGKNQATMRPDGLIHAVRGRKDWKGLVEAKVGDSPLEQEQFDAYFELASRENLDALITVSNQAGQADGTPPHIKIDGRRAKKVRIIHFSWERLLSEAEFLGDSVEDDDQRWMLAEWSRYIADERSKIIEEPHLGKHWKTVLRAARERNLQSVSAELEDVVYRWNSFLSKTALKLRAELQAKVEPRLSRSDKKDPKSRLKRLHQEALDNSRLPGSLRIDRAAGDIDIDVFLPENRVRFNVSLDAPTEGRTSTRIKWLLKQLERGDAVPADLLIKIDWDRRNLSSQARFGDLEKGADPLMRDLDGNPVPKDSNPKRIHIEWWADLRKARGRSTVPILEGVVTDLWHFYQNVLEGLVPYVPKAPQLPERKGGAGETPSESDAQAKEETDRRRPRKASGTEARSEASDALKNASDALPEAEAAE